MSKRWERTHIRKARKENMRREWGRKGKKWEKKGKHGKEDRK